MKKTLIFTIAILFILPSFSQRLKVNTVGFYDTYKKHYSHIIDGVYVNDSTHVFIGGNRNDRPIESNELSGHKIYASGVSLIKKQNY